MTAFDLTLNPHHHAAVASPAPGVRAAALLDEGQAKVRRIELDAGGVIPPCQMSEDVVFVLLRGSAMVTAGADEEPRRRRATRRRRRKALESSGGLQRHT